MSLHLFNNVKEPTKTPAQLPYPFFSGRSARQVCCDCLGDRVGHRCGDTHLGGPPLPVNTKLHFYDICGGTMPSRGLQRLWQACPERISPMVWAVAPSPSGG